MHCLDYLAAAPNPPGAGSGSNSPRLPISMLGNQPIPNPRVQFGNAATQQFRVPTSMSIDKAWLVVNKAWLVARNQKGTGKFRRETKRGQASSGVHCLDHLMPVPKWHLPNHPHGARCLDRLSKRGQASSGVYCLDHLMPVPK
ncbi:hypothetical protein Mal33_46230 [Rosistilla oblonga]|uniref:Uncharacterized protein n=1 Tax=Rosistilla oblonga TaxID=2527990 RepID=A0A518IZT0_9BACT|nr:hypothetical protein Mal33_46230 [Rosistilla oblonga]